MFDVPTDLRQFTVKHLLGMLTSLGLALGVSRFLPISPLLLPTLALLTWIGLGCFALADVIDPRPIDERTLVSKVFNALGLLFFPLSLLGVLVHIGVNLYVGIRILVD